MYEKEIAQLMEKISSLEKLYEQVNNQVLYNQTLFWSIILGVIGIIGIALFFIAKNMIQIRIQHGIDEIKKNNADDFTKLIGKVEILFQGQAPSGAMLFLSNHITQYNELYVVLKKDESDIVTRIASKYYPSNIQCNGEILTVYNGKCKIKVVDRQQVQFIAEGMAITKIVGIYNRAT